MISTPKSNRWYASLGLFLFGLITVVIVTFATFWPNMEASLFDTSTTAEETLQTLQCPRVLSADENSAISASIHNPLERPATLLVRARISEGRVTLQRQFSGYIDLEPGETREMSWEINADDAVYNRIIMARVYVGPSRPIPNRQASCGVLVLPFGGIPGQPVLLTAIGLSLASLGIGSVMLWRQTQPFTPRQRSSATLLSLLTVTVLIALIMALLNLWVGAIVALILAFILSAVMLERLFSH